MRSFCLLSLLVGLASNAWAAQINFDFSKDTPGRMPPGFVSLVTGDGEAGRLERRGGIGAADTGAALGQSPPHPCQTSRAPVQSPDARADHFPVLLFTNEVFTDFTLTTQVQDFRRPCRCDGRRGFARAG
jgi:hypothetical protein